MTRTISLSHARKFFVGVMAAFVALFGISGSLTPRANAQVTAEAITAAIAAAGAAIGTGAQTAADVSSAMADFCGAVYGEDTEGLADCVKETGKEAFNAKDALECMADATDTDKIEECIRESLDDEEEEEEQKTPEQPDDYSLYRMSSALTAFYVNSLVPGGFDAGKDSDSGSDSESGSENEGGEGGDATAEQTAENAKGGLDAWSCLLNSPSMAGGFVAKPNKDNLENKNWLLGYGDANNDAVFTYSALDRSSDPTWSIAQQTDACGGRTALGGGGSSLNDAGVSAYSYYGATLAGLGFDQTAARDSMDAAQSKIMGYGMMAAFIGAGFVDVVFDTVITILDKLNPFALIYRPITENTNPTFTEGMRGDGDSGSGALDGLVDFLSTMYKGFYDLGWLVTIPVFIGLFIAGALLMRRYAIGDGAKKLVIRIAFLTLGVPLLGVSYTAGLDSMKGATGDAGTSNAAKIVNSTYIDFEAWVNHRLALPSGKVTAAAWDVEAQRPGETSQARARGTALAINAMTHPALAEVVGAGQGIMETDRTWIGETAGQDDGTEESKDSDVYRDTLSMLNAYISGDRVSAAGFESEVKGKLTEMANQDGADAATILVWIKDFSSAEDIAGMTAEDVAALRNPVLQVAGTGLTAQRQGGTITFGAPVSSSVPSLHERWACSPSTLTAGDAPVTGPDSVQLSDCPMSVLSMYNYLNTTFDTTSATAFSPASSTSSWTREQHQSVNAIGSGITSFVYWFSAMALLASFAIIGFLYALSMMFGVIKRSLQLIAAIPFATLGFLAGIAKVIVYTISMFLEIFMTIFVYKVVQELLMVFPEMIETPIIEKSEGGGFLADNAVTAVIGVTVICSVAVIIFTVMAVKMRGTLVQALDEASTNVINKIVGTNVSAGASAADGGSFKAAAARGLAMGGASHLMGGGGNDSGNTPDATGPNGPDNTDNTGDAAMAGGAAGTALVDPDDRPQDITGVSDTGGDITGENVDGGDVTGPVSADGVDADEAVLPAGEYDVDPKTGEITDAKTGEVMTDPDTGRPLQLGDVAGIDAQGNVLGADGQPVIGADGQPVKGSDVAGIDSHGRLMGSDGAVTDSSGAYVAAGGAGSVDAGGTGYGTAQSAFTGQEGTDVASTEATAEQIMARGGLTPYNGGDSYADAGAGGTAYAPEGAAGPTVDGGAAASGLGGAGSAEPGMSPVSASGDTAYGAGQQSQQSQYDGSQAGAVGATAGAAGAAAAVMGAARSGSLGHGAGSAVAGGEQTVGAFKSLSGSNDQVSGPAGGYNQGGHSQGAPGAPGQAAPAGQYGGANQGYSPGQPGQGQGYGPVSGGQGTARGDHTSTPNPMLGMVGMNLASAAAGRLTGPGQTSRTVHESVSGSRGNGGGNNALNQAGQSGGQGSGRSARRSRRGAGSDLTTAAGMGLAGQWGQTQPGQGNQGVRGQNPFAAVNPNLVGGQGVYGQNPMYRPDGTPSGRTNGSGNVPGNRGEDR